MTIPAKASDTPARTSEESILEAARRYSFRARMDKGRFEGPVFVRGAGSEVEDVNGKRYLDFNSGQMCAWLGHNQPAITAAVAEACDTLVHAHSSYFNDKEVELAERLAAIMPPPLEKSLFLQSGADANEAAVNIARDGADLRERRRTQPRGEPRTGPRLRILAHGGRRAGRRRDPRLGGRHADRGVGGRHAGRDAGARAQAGIGVAGALGPHPGGTGRSDGTAAAAAAQPAAGAIPRALGAPGTLASLDLSHNQLSGAIPEQLGALQDLWFLSLEGNELTGAIPATLGALSSLGRLRLSDNQLSGAIPASLGDLSALWMLRLNTR